MGELKRVFIALFLVTNFIVVAQAENKLDELSKLKVKGVFKGARIDSKSGEVVITSEQSIPNLDDDGETSLPAETHFTEFYAKRIRSGQQQYLVALWNAETAGTDAIGGGAAILAIFHGGSDKPLEVVSVKKDRFTFFAPETLSVLGKNDAFIIYNSHSNSSQGYLISDLFHIYNGKLQQIDSIFTLTARGLCGSFSEDPVTWKKLKQNISNYHSFKLNVILTGKSENKDDESCVNKKPVKKQIFSKVYHWNQAKQRYDIKSKNFQVLDKFNEQNF